MAVPLLPHIIVVLLIEVGIIVMIEIHFMCTCSIKHRSQIVSGNCDERMQGKLSWLVKRSIIYFLYAYQKMY